MNDDDTCRDEPVDLGAAATLTCAKAGPVPEFTTGFHPPHLSDD